MNDEFDDGPGMTEEEIAALPHDPSEMFDPTGCVSSREVKADALLQRPASSPDAKKKPPPT